MLTGSDVQRGLKFHSLPSWANNAAGVAEKGGESKRTPPGNRADTGPVPGAKASPLLSGLSSRESLTNWHQGAKQMEAEQSVGAASDLPGHWREVNWRSGAKDVRRLQVRIVAVGQTFKEEHLYVPGEGQIPCEEVAECSGMATDNRPQPDNPGLGDVSPPSQEHSHLQQRRPCHLHRTLALSLEAASTEG